MVNKLSVILMLILSTISCGSDNNIYNWQTTKVEYNITDGNARDQVEISYPLIVNDDRDAAQKINRTIQSTISQTIDPKASSVDIALDNIFALRAADSVISHIPYSVIVSAEVYQYELCASVKLSIYTFFGGANGIQQNRFLNFDLETGEVKDIDKLINLDEELLARVREAVCLSQNIKPTDTKEQSGLFFAPSEIPFPKEIGFREDGVVFLYNMYEIAPRSNGVIEVVIDNK
ncbi:MAG: DUF4163 domain-containing protein [Rikenellaceae bacterium]